MVYQKMVQSAKNEIHENIIKAACHLFITHDINSIKMTDIATEANVGVATLYRYYGTKKELVILCAIRLWETHTSEVGKSFTGVYYATRTGLEQIQALLEIFIALYTNHTQFLRFIRNFDLFIENENIQPYELSEYEEKILDIYPLFKTAYEKGIKDYSIQNQLDFEAYYFTISHTLMSLCQKLVFAGHLIESDDLIQGKKQIEMIIQMALHYIKRI